MPCLLPTFRQARQTRPTPVSAPPRCRPTASPARLPRHSRTQNALQASPIFADGGAAAACPGLGTGGSECAPQSMAAAPSLAARLAMPATGKPPVGNGRRLSCHTRLPATQPRRLRCAASRRASPAPACRSITALLHSSCDLRRAATRRLPGAAARCCASAMLVPLCLLTSWCERSRRAPPPRLPVLSAHPSCPHHILTLTRALSPPHDSSSSPTPGPALPTSPCSLPANFSLTLPSLHSCPSLPTPP